MNALIKYFCLIGFATLAARVAAEPSKSNGGKAETPTGSWYCIFPARSPHGTVTITSTLTIAPDGTARWRHVTKSAMDSGYFILRGKFQGLTEVSWTTATSGPPHRVVRVGNELYIYNNKTDDKLVSGSPPGFTLYDYQNLGVAGAYTRLDKPGDGGVDIYLIDGKNLVLAASTDRRRYIFKPIGRR